MTFKGNDVNLEEADIKRSAPKMDYQKYIKKFFGKNYRYIKNFFLSKNFSVRNNLKWKKNWETPFKKNHKQIYLERCDPVDNDFWIRVKIFIPKLFKNIFTCMLYEELSSRNKNTNGGNKSLITVETF